MTLVWIVLALFLLLDAFILFLVWRKPDQFRIERRATFKASPEAIYNQLNSFDAWQAWSPWARKDPNAKAEFSAQREGKGASFGWDGNNKIGKGRMTIIDAAPGKRVAMQLDFERPMKATNFAEFNLRTVPAGTELVWSMEGKSNFMSKLMDVLMNMDRMVGRDFEEGLGNIRKIVEANKA